MSKRRLKIDTFEGYVEGIDMFWGCVEMGMPGSSGEEFEQCRVFVDDFTFTDSPLWVQPNGD